MAFLSQALRLGYLLSPHSAFQGHAAHTTGWSAMLSPNGSSDTCISDGVFHIPMPCFHGAIPVYPKVFRHSSMPLSRRTNGVPQPAWVRFATHVTPHFVQLGGQPAPSIQFLRAADLHRDLLGM